MKLLDNRSIAVSVLLLSLAATMTAWRFGERYASERRLARFDQETQQIETAIRDRMAAYEQVLLGARGLLNSHEVTRDEWHSYIKALMLPERYPGIQGLGFAPLVRHSQKQAYIQQIRSHGLPEYDIRPAGEREEYAPVLFDNPFAEASLNVTGFDVLSDPTRRSAMEKARDSGSAALTAKLRLLRKPTEPGLLMYLPVYEGGATPTTLEGRQRLLHGYAYVPLRAGALMESILASVKPDIDFSVYDGSQTSPETLLFARNTPSRTGGNNLSRTMTVEIAGRPWTITFNASPAFDSATRDPLPVFALAAGMVITGLLFAITWSLGERREHATRLAEKMTVELQSHAVSLREMGDRFQAVVQSTNEAIIIFDGAGKIIFCNRGAQKMFAYKEPEMLGQSFTVLMPERYRDSNIAGLRRYLELGEKGMIGRTGTLLGLKRDGEEFTLELSLTTWKKENEIFFGGIFRDITERIRAEETLRESEARYRDLFESASDLIQSVNPDGTLEYVNGAWMQLLGYTPFDVSRLSIFEVVDREHRDYYRDVFERVLAGGKMEKIETVFVAKDGRRVVVEGSSSCKFAGGKPVAVRSIFRDVTRRWEIDKMKDEFVSVISHELRTPLTSIRASLGLLANGLLGNVGEKAQRMIQIAVVNTDRLIRLINDILVAQELASGAIKIDRRTCDVGQLMLRAEDSVRSMAAESRVRLRSTLLQAEVFADADRIYQVLTNLLSNAIKFSPPDSYVTLAAERNGSEILFRVEDNGRGIPSNKLETVFERFQQVDASDSRDKPGTGLGLAICRSIVEQHDGRIWVESTLGKGSTFLFTIPASPRPDGDAEELPRATATTSPLQH